MLTCLLTYLRTLQHSNNHAAHLLVQYCYNNITKNIQKKKKEKKKLNKNTR